MAKASFTLTNGTNVVIEGTPEEVQGLLAYYTSLSTSVIATPQKPKEIGKVISSGVQNDKSNEKDIDKIVEIIKTCPEAEAIENFILDNTNEANRVLLPLYIVHEHINETLGLSTNDISEITIALGVKVSRQNALRAVKFGAPGYVIKFGNPPRYKINRRGISHIKSILSGVVESDTEQQPKKSPAKNKKGKKSTKAKGAQAFILELKENSFFSKQRTISDVQKKLEEMGHIFAQASLSTPLIRLVRSKKLKRIKVDSAWTYIDQEGN